MIQRQQTLWLLLTTICGILSFKFPFVTGEKVVEATTMRSPVELVAGDNFLLLILTIAAVCISTISIFFFKDRKMQTRLCIIGLLISLGLMVVYVLEMQKLVDSTIAIWSLLVLLMIIGYIMAIRGIRHDEKLVKSLDKLR